MNKDYEKIIDFIYNHPSVPEEIRTAINEWMIRHEDDPELSSVMLSKWDEELSGTTDNINPEALSNLLNEISYIDEPRIRRKAFSIRKIVKYAAVAAAICLSSIVTYYAVNSSKEKETVLITAKNSTGEFTLPDGTTVRLNSDTRLTYDSRSFMADGKRRVSVEGEAFFNVTKDAEHPFVVKLTGMDVEVLGTSFDVRNYSFSSKEEVVLLTGKVRVESKDIKGPVTISPDQRFVLDRKNGEYNVEETEAINYCRWIEPKLKLENEPLGDLLITVSRKYSVELDIDPSVDLDRRLSITLHNDGLDELMPIICYLTEIDYSIDGNTLHIRN